jgi:RimJ/RimL family protein N-acetyltransferase
MYEFNNIVLEPLSENKIEQVRNWRNSPEICVNMQYQAFISKAEQLIWYKELQKENSHYFIIKASEKDAGLIHINKINELEKTAEVGLFIGEKEFVGTGVALYASFILLMFAFDKLELKILKAKVNSKNITAIDYNGFLGFEFFQKLDEQFNYYELTKETYELKKPVFQKLLSLPL